MAARIDMEWFFILALLVWVWLQSRHWRQLSDQPQLSPSRAPAKEALLLITPAAEAPPLELTQPLPSDIPAQGHSSKPGRRSKNSLLISRFTRSASQPLCVAGVLIAYLAIALAEQSEWPPLVITTLALLCLASGLALAWRHAWRLAAAASLFGAYIWFSRALGADDYARASLLAFFAAAGACALVVQHRWQSDVVHAPHWRELCAMAPSIGLALSAFLVAMEWAALAGAAMRVADASIAAPALAGIGLAALAGVMRRNKLVDAWSTAATIIALPAGFYLFLLLRMMIGEVNETLTAWALIAAASAALVGVFANPQSRLGGDGRALLAATGAISTVLLALIAFLPWPSWRLFGVWAALLLVALALCFAARIAARSATDVKIDPAIAAWAAGAACTLYAAMRAMAPTRAEPLAIALAALAFAYLFNRTGWRAWRVVSVFCAALAVVRALSSDILLAAQSHHELIWPHVVFLFAAAGVLALAANVMRARDTNNDTHEALSLTALLSSVIAVLLLLYWFASGGPESGEHARWTPFLAHALNSLALIAIGYFAASRTPDNAGWIARLQGHGLIIAGLLYLLLGPGFLLNPWWGVAPAAIHGPPLLNKLALAFAAPALICASIAKRLQHTAPAISRPYLWIACAIAALWLVMEIRHAFHAPTLSTPALSLLEAHFYGFGALLATTLLSFRNATKSALLTEARRAAPKLTWPALTIALVILVVSHPAVKWPTATTDSALMAACATLLHLAAAICCFALARRLKGPIVIRVCGYSALAFGLSFGFAAIRLAFHVNDTHGALGPMEAFAYILWPLTFAIIIDFIFRARAFFINPWRRLSWPALTFCSIGLGIIFTQFQGFASVKSTDGWSFAYSIAAYLIGAGLCILADRRSGALAPRAFSAAAKLSALLLLFCAANIAVRFMSHMSNDPSVGAFTQSIVWLLFGATAFGLGRTQKWMSLRIAGGVLLICAMVKVLAFDLSDASTSLRAVLVLMLLALMFVGVYAARRLGQRAPLKP